MSAELERIVWEEHERGWHVTIAVRELTYSATGATRESALEALVLALADSLTARMA